MDAQKLQQFEEDLKHAINESLRTSSIGKVFTKYGIPDNAVEWQYTLDMSKIQSSDADKNQPGQELLAGIQKPPMKLAGCTIVWCEECAPDGTWICI